MNEVRLGAVAGEIDPDAVRTVSDVETLKALADPVRLAILSAMMRGSADGLRVMTVKELAAELDDSQTKLYRHVKQLEAVGLIKSVASRLVSGIVEHRYQACQADLILGPGLTETQKSSSVAEDTVAAALEMYRRQFFAAHRAQEPDGRQMMLGLRVARLSPARAADIYQRLLQIQDDLAEAEAQGKGGADQGETDGTVKINVLVGYFTAPQPAPDEARS